ncbi:fructose-1,6-bisphosphatase [Candidatus Peregrinibacteria bacterium]|nr:MAG: fructose-1,6-bisphosphatase [Candidatus Peregrinibacteria bacterium]
MNYDFLIHRGATSELAELLVELGRAIEDISKSILQASTKKAGSQNAYGEEQIAMDVMADEILNRTLKTNPYVAAYCSEEQDGMQEANPEGIFSVFHDPLDGSSLFDVNFSVGTIVGIYPLKKVLGHTPREQVAALYAVYGPRTTVMLSIGKGVQEFLLTAEGWVQVSEDVKVAAGKKYFAPGNLRATAEREDYLKLVNCFITEQYTLRYSGGMVPDLNHIFKKGSGVFMYPGMPSAPEGKLRLMYECGPMAFLMEQAGGASSNGKISILDLEIASLTQKTPVYLGTQEEVEKVCKAML